MAAPLLRRSDKISPGLYIHADGSRQESMRESEFQNDNCYVGMGILIKKWGREFGASAPKTKEVAEFCLETRETFPFLLELWREKVVAFVEVWVDHHSEIDIIV